MGLIRKLGAAKPGLLMDPDAPLEFVLSDDTVDSYDDQIEVFGWVLDDFRRNPVALLSHNPELPIGTWQDVRVERGALRGNLKLAPAGASRRIDEVRALISVGVIRACSVGFSPLESMPRPGSKRGGVLYTRQILREVSAVSIPANSNALLETARAMGTSDFVMKAVFSPSRNASLSERQMHARANIARAKALIAQVDARMAREKAEAKLHPSTRAAKATIARIDARIAREASIDAEVKAIVEAERRAQRRERAQYAIPGEGIPRWPGDDYEPSLYFGDKPMFRKKNRWGW